MLFIIWRTYNLNSIKNIFLFNRQYVGVAKLKALQFKSFYDKQATFLNNHEDQYERNFWRGKFPKKRTTSTPRILSMEEAQQQCVPVSVQLPGPINGTAGRPPPHCKNLCQIYLLIPPPSPLHSRFVFSRDILYLCRWFRFAQLAKGKKFRP
jgi:hypothetical protein